MKDFLVTDYVFSPGTSGVGYVEFLNLPDFDITRVVAVINQTQGVLIYATSSIAKRYTSVSGTRIYLNEDTSTYSASDKLQVVYNSSTALQTADDTSQNLLRMLSRLVKILESNAVVDQQQRQRVTIDSITGSLTLAAVTTVGTVSSISAGTLTAVNNVVATAGMDREQYINIAKNTYANSIRSKLEFV